MQGADEQHEQVLCLGTQPGQPVQHLRCGDGEEDAVEDLAGGEQAAERDEGLAGREQQLELHDARGVRARVRIGAPREQRAHRLQCDGREEGLLHSLAHAAQREASVQLRLGRLAHGTALRDGGLGTLPEPALGRLALLLRQLAPRRAHLCRHALGQLLRLRTLHPRLGLSLDARLGLGRRRGRPLPLGSRAVGLYLRQYRGLRLGHPRVPLEAALDLDVVGLVVVGRVEKGQQLSAHEGLDPQRGQRDEAEQCGERPDNNGGHRRHEGRERPAVAQKGKEAREGAVERHEEEHGGDGAGDVELEGEQSVEEVVDVLEHRVCSHLVTVVSLAVVSNAAVSILEHRARSHLVSTAIV